MQTQLTLSVVDFFPKKLHLRYLFVFWICLCDCFNCMFTISDEIGLILNCIWSYVQEDSLNQELSLNISYSLIWHIEVESTIFREDCMHSKTFLKSRKKFGGIDLKLSLGWFYSVMDERKKNFLQVHVFHLCWGLWSFFSWYDPVKCWNRFNPLKWIIQHI